MNGSDGSEIIARMLQAAQRLVDALAEKGATRVSESHHEFPQGVRDGLDRTMHGAEQTVAELDRLDPAGHVNRDTDATQSATEGRSPDSSIEEHTRRGGRDRSEISAEEARELYEQVRDREPDFAGTGNRVSLVDTSAGPAVIRFGLERPIGTLLKKWMPENAAINYARECGVRTPKILHAGTDPSTGREFTIMQYVPGETCKFDDPEVMNWLPDLLDQVQLTSSRPLPAGMNLDIPGWQQQMIRHGDEAYHNLPPEQRSRQDQLGIGPLSDYVRPDLGRSGEPVVFAHNDLYPLNLRLDDQGKLWLLDWETAGPSDPLYNAVMFLDRMGTGVDDATRAQASNMWLDRIMPANSAVDTGATLGMYRTMEDWRAVTMWSETMPRDVSANPDGFEQWVDWYDTKLSRHPEQPWPDIPKDELRALLRGWVE